MFPIVFARAVLAPHSAVDLRRPAARATEGVPDTALDFDGRVGVRRMQVFYDTGRGFSEPQSLQAPLVSSPDPQEYALKLPPGLYRAFRIDPHRPAVHHAPRADRRCARLGRRDLSARVARADRAPRRRRTHRGLARRRHAGNRPRRSAVALRGARRVEAVSGPSHRGGRSANAADRVGCLVRAGARPRPRVESRGALVRTRGARAVTIRRDTSAAIDHPCRACGVARLDVSGRVLRPQLCLAQQRRPRLAVRPSAVHARSGRCDARGHARQRHGGDDVAIRAVCARRA